MMFKAKFGNPGGILRDLKKFTSREICKVLKASDSKSYAGAILATMNTEASKRSNVKHFQFWQHSNRPMELWTNTVIDQKAAYIQNNPVAAGLVTEPSDWKYSSAYEPGLILLDEM